MFLYALGPPAVHVLHGRLGVGLADLGVRSASNFLGLATAGTIVALGFPDGVTGTALYVGIGAVVTGVLVPVIIDAAVLSSATVVHYSDRPPTISSSWSVAPFVSTVRCVSDDGNRCACG